MTISSQRRARLGALLGLTGLAFCAAANARDIEIFGSPVTAVSAGRAYDFTPATSGNVGRRMSFSIANKPVWAKFNRFNGELSGTPGAAHAGASRVTISVSDGKTSDSMAFTLQVKGSAAPAVTNRAPTIGGKPVTQIQSGQAYNFVPQGSDQEGDKLSYSISSKPAWASFDPATGRLSGVPSRQQAGSYEEIQISVSDGKKRVALPMFAIEVQPAAPAMRNVTLAWLPPVLNTDGSALTDLSGYKILYGTHSQQYTGSIQLTSAGLTRYLVENLPAGTYYFVMVAVNGNGTESDRSSEVAIDLG